MPLNTQHNPICAPSNNVLNRYDICGDDIKGALFYNGSKGLQALFAAYASSRSSDVISRRRLWRQMVRKGAHSIPVIHPLCTFIHLYTPT